MEENIKNRLEKIAETDIFQVATLADNFVGYPFYLDYKKANLLTCDDWKYKSGGVPQGCLMLAFYNNPFNTVQSEEAILLRAIKPCAIPSDSDLITSKIEFYKEDVDITTTKSKGNALDDFTRFEFSFSGIECSILGTFYKNENGKIEFGADVENFFSAHYYKVYKIIPVILSISDCASDNFIIISTARIIVLLKPSLSSENSSSDFLNIMLLSFIVNSLHEKSCGSSCFIEYATLSKNTGSFR